MGRACFLPLSIDFVSLIFNLGSGFSCDGTEVDYFHFLHRFALLSQNMLKGLVYLSVNSSLGPCKLHHVMTEYPVLLFLQDSLRAQDDLVIRQTTFNRQCGPPAGNAAIIDIASY